MTGQLNTNESQTYLIASFNEQDFQPVTSVPFVSTRLTDGSDTGYEGFAEVLVHHPEPPYYHQGIM